MKITETRQIADVSVTLSAEFDPKEPADMEALERVHRWWETPRQIKRGD